MPCSSRPLRNSGVFTTLRMSSLSFLTTASGTLDDTATVVQEVAT